MFIELLTKLTAAASVVAIGLAVLFTLVIPMAFGLFDRRP